MKQTIQRILVSLAVLAVAGTGAAKAGELSITETTITIATKERKADKDAVDTAHKAVALENRYLRVLVMPQIGGRLYRAVFKPTGQDLFFHNQLLTKDDVHNLAAMQFNFPQVEHAMGYVPWEYKIKKSKRAVTLTQWCVIDENFPIVYKWMHSSFTEPTLKITVDITLEAGRSFIRIDTRLENLTDKEQKAQYWLDSLHDALDNTEFIFATEWMVGHGGAFRFKDGSALPGDWQHAFAWPNFRGVNLNWQKNWNGANGLFAAHYLSDFAGIYHHDKKIGVVRIFPHEICRGVKLWTFGAPKKGKTLSFTHGPLLNELWFGLTRNFNETRVLRPREKVEWTEHWYPVVATGGFNDAGRDLAFNIGSRRDGKDYLVDLWIAPSGVFEKARIRVTMFKGEIHSETADLAPDKPVHLQIKVPADRFMFPITVTVHDKKKKLLGSVTRKVAVSTIFWHGIRQE